jgi:ABC-type sugar transport system permease subunit
LNTENTNKHINTRNLNRHLFWLITVALIVVVAFVVCSFVINIVLDRSYADIENAENNTIKLTDFIRIIKDPPGMNNTLLPYLGILMLIAIPVTGLLYAAGYFLYRKNIKFALISAGVFLIIVISLVIGFMLQ